MSRRQPFVTVDVFTDQRFGGNPLAVFTDARGLDSATMQALAREMNMSEVAFILPPADPGNTAQVRIFTTEMEITFAGHPNVGAGWVLAQSGRDRDGMLRFEEKAGLVEVTVTRRNGVVTECKVAAPLPLSVEPAPSRAELAACVGLDPSELGDAEMASVSLATACIPVSAAALARAQCDLPAFRAIASRYPRFAQIFLVCLFCRDGNRVRSRVFAPLSGTIEDPATGSAAAALTGWLLHGGRGEHLALEVVQGVELGRPSRMSCEARRQGDRIQTWVGGGCVPVFRGEAEV